VTSSLPGIARSIVRLAWPVLVAQLAVISTGVLDTIMAGRYSAVDLAAVQVSGMTDADELAMGRYHVCARRIAGACARTGPRLIPRRAARATPSSTIPAPSP